VHLVGFIIRKYLTTDYDICDRSDSELLLRDLTNVNITNLKLDGTWD